MAQLSETDRQRIWRGLMRSLAFGWTGEKDDLRAAVDASDTWVDGNAASFKNALPEPFQSASTAEQKARLLSVTTAMRVGVELARLLLGEVD